MKLWNLEKTPDGGVKVQTVLTDEEVLFMLELAMIGLMQRGLVPASIAKHMEENQNENQLEFLEGVDKDEIGQA